MPSKSRRLPGGKVRRPQTRPTAGTAPQGADAAAPPDAGEAAGPPAGQPASAASTAEIPASRRQAPQTIELPVGAMPSAAAAPLVAGAAAPATGAAAAPRRRGAVTNRSQS